MTSVEIIFGHLLIDELSFLFHYSFPAINNEIKHAFIRIHFLFICFLRTFNFTSSLPENFFNLFLYVTNFSILYRPYYYFTTNFLFSVIINSFE
jgi:hypothetical protein